MVYVEGLILLAVLLCLLYKWSIAKYNILNERLVPHEKPKPLIGNSTWKELLGQSSFIRSILDRYVKFKDSKVYGVYSARLPIIFIRDPVLIKKMCIKDFEIFSNHKSSLKPDDTVFARGLIALKDRKWKEMRNTLTPSFTGSKMRLMFELINEVCMEGVKYIELQTTLTGKHELNLEVKEYFTRFANDVIASVAFGIKINSYKDTTNKFFTNCRSLTQFKGMAVVRAVLFQIMPKVMKALNIKRMDEKKINYLKKLVFDAISYRQEHKIIRPDMIQLLMEAKHKFEKTQSHDAQQEHAEFNDDDLLAQCLLFIFAGFETVSTCLCFTVYELLMNQNVQQCLYEEIVEVERELNGKPLDYDTLLKMKYMDMVISESLRLWPPTIITDRECAADYQLMDDDGNMLADIKKDDLIFIPIVGIHRDPDNFDDPLKFVPERFSEENKSNIKPFSYIPFGVGPRNCIANRLALMEVKSIIYHIVLKFKLAATDKTSIDMLNSIQGIQLVPKELFWTKFISREN